MLNPRGQTIISAALVLIACLTALSAFFSSSLQVSFIFLLSLVIFLITLTNTNAALVILIFSMLLSPQLKAGGGIPGRAVVIRIDDVLLFVVFFGWMAKMAVNKELGLLKKTPLNGPILTYMFICLFSTFFGIIQGNIVIKQAFFYLLKYFEYFLLYFMVINNIKTIKEAKVFVFFILLTCFIVCVYGWYQIPSGQRLTAPFEVTAEGEPNTFAGYLLLMLGLILGLIVHSVSKKQQFILIGLFAFAFVPFLLTLSRGGWLGFFPMYMTFIFLGRRYRFHLITVLLLFILSASFIFPQKVYDRVKETFAPEKSVTVFEKKIMIAESAAERINAWHSAFVLLRRSPLIGMGVPAGAVVDNQYTRVLSETGIAGFLIFIWLMWSVFKVAVRAYNNYRENNFAQGISLGFIAGFMGLLMQSFSAASFIIVRIMEPFWFLTAILVIWGELV